MKPLMGEWEGELFRDPYTDRRSAYASEFLRGSLGNRCGPYVDELKELMRETYGKEVSNSTIRRSLLRAGFRLKKIIHPFFLSVCSDVSNFFH